MILYHNPQCSKSREVLEKIEEYGVPFEVVDYLRTPLTYSELRALSRKLQLRPRAMLREKEPILASLSLDRDDDTAVLQAIATHPILLERPILQKGEEAVIARPIENACAFFDDKGR